MKVTVHIVFGDKADELHERAEEVPEMNVWTQAELHDGVGSIEVHASGDDTTGAFVKVAGIDLDACRRAYVRVMASLPTSLTRWWNERKEEART